VFGTIKTSRAGYGRWEKQLLPALKLRQTGIALSCKERQIADDRR
jgi:hypothetical protein